MSDTVMPAPSVAKPRRTLTRAVIRFAGDSGDGMQVTGEQFTTEAAWAGNDISTLPNFPAEIRAPAGTLFGVSSFQLQFGSQRVYTPGDQLDSLVAMNPAALKVYLGDLKAGGILIVNTAAFDQRNLEKAGYPKDEKGEPKSPLNDPGLAEKYRLYQVDISGMSKKCLEDLPLNAKEKERCKNFFALGLVSWIYTRPLDPTLDAIKKRFAKNPTFVEANIRVLKAGHAFGETAEMFSEHYGIEAAEMPAGVYRSMTGNRALAWGLLAAAERTKIPIVFGAYPITPASSILEELALHKRWRVRTFQAEDEIAAVTSAIGASFGGALGVTASSGPGIALKGEGIGLAVMAELPLVIFDIQRGGPSTGLPTKTEQADLMQALYGRNSESPIVVIAPSTPGDCFYIAYEAENHDHMVRTRAEKVRRVAQEIPPTVINGPESGDVLVVGWGGTYGAITAAVEEAQMEGKAVASVHIRHLNPLPPDLGQILRQYRRVLVPEINSGQLVRVLRAEYLVDAVGFNRVRGMPLASQELLEAINQLLEAKR